jgi:glycosyltransferase involved in cell wall biosynthesis
MLSAQSHVNMVAIVARLITSSPERLVVSEHNTMSMASRNNAKQKMVPLLARCLYRSADEVVAVSNGVADDLVMTIGLQRKRITTIYNPVVSGDIHRMASMRPSHPWMDNARVPVILSVGRLTPQKDFASLIRAFAIVRKHRPARLIILGEGPERAGLESIVASRGLGRDVALPGFVQNPYCFMKRAAVFVLSSRFEGLPTVLIEAMACGSRVVSTDCPSGPAEILEGGRWGSLVAVGDEVALASAIERGLDHDGPDDASERAREFSVDRAVSAYAKILSLSI